MILAGIVCLLLLTTLAGGGTGPTPSGGLYGTVTRGPVEPVCRVGVPCDEPAARTTLLLSRRGSIFRLRTDADGRYRVRLAPGRYAVRKPDWGPGSVRPTTVRVVSGRYVRVPFFVDTGIR